MLDLRWNLGGLDLYAIESLQARSIQAAVHEREGDGNYHRMSVSVSEGSPPVISGISLTVIPPPDGAPTPRRLTQQAAAAAWRAEIARAASNGKFSGVWLWAKNGKAIASGAAGTADRAAGIDATLRTRFRILRTPAAGRPDREGLGEVLLRRRRREYLRGRRHDPFGVRAGDLRGAPPEQRLLAGPVRPGFQRADPAVAGNVGGR